MAAQAHTAFGPGQAPRLQRELIAAVTGDTPCTFAAPLLCGTKHGGFFERWLDRAGLTNQVHNLNAFVLLNSYYEVEQCQGKLYRSLITSL